MIALFVFSIWVFGIAYCAGHAKISLPFRTWLAKISGPDETTAGNWLLALIECPACLSWWLGLVSWLFRLTPPHLFSWWASAFYCCATSLLLAKLAGLDDDT